MSLDLVGELQELSSRADAVRLGGPDASLSSDYESFLTGRLIPQLDQLRSQAEFNNIDTFSLLTRCLELVKAVSPAHVHARLLALECVAKLTVSFEPGPSALARHMTLCNVLWDAIETDKEENALMAIKAFLHLYRAGHVVMDAELSTRLHRFVAWLRALYANAARLFDTEPLTAVPSSQSVRVLKECAMLVHLLVQVFSGAAESYLSALLGDMLNLFALTDVARPLQLAEVQVKTLTFVAYVGRSSRSDALRSLDQQFAKACVRLLRSIPVNANINTRRELILNVRSCFHSPDLCVAFVPLLDELFDDSVMVGVGRGGYDVLRPIVVSALADFANAVKDKLPMDKLKRVLAYFCGCMADADLPVSAQFTSARIVLNVVDHVFNKSSNRTRKMAAPASADGSDILREVLRAVTEKFSALVLFVPKTIQLISEGLSVDLPAGSPAVQIDRSEILARLVGKASPTTVPLADLLIEGVREVRSLVRTLLLCAKMVVHCLTHRVTSRLLTKADVSLLECLVEDGLKVAHLFACAAGYVQSAGFDASLGNSSANGGGRFATATELAIACSVQEERDLIEQIAGVLVVVPPVSLTDLLAKRIVWLIDAMQTNSQLMALCNGLAQSPASMAVLCEVLCGFLAVRGEDVLIGSQSVRTSHQTRQFAVDADIDPSACISGVEAAEDMPVIPPGAARLHPASYGYRSAVLNPSGTLLGQPNACAYWIGDSGAIDGSLLVTHVMPSLDAKLRQYCDIVTAYGLRESGVMVDARDVVVTLAKTLSRQVVSFTAAGNGGNLVMLEPTVRPFITEITMTCVRVAKLYPTSAAHAAGILRYLFRLMGSGSKTTSTNRELADLVPFVVDQCVGLSRSWRDSRTLSALWLEIALTIPVRLKSLITHFETITACLTAALAVDQSAAGETVSVALSVLESWVDGLTPDFIFPLIPGHGEVSLARALLALTTPPAGHVVHTTVSGNSSVRATKILGKLGAKAKYVLESNNVVGESVLQAEVSTEFVINVAGTFVAVELSHAIRSALDLLKRQSEEGEVLPVALQDQPVDANEVALIPEQHLLDALNVVMTALAAHKQLGNATEVRILSAGLICACACSSELVAERAKSLVSDLLVADAGNGVSGLVAGAIDCLSASWPRRTESAVSVIVEFVGLGQDVSGVIEALSDKLLALHWSEVVGACSALMAVLGSEHSSVVGELGASIIAKCVEAHAEAEGTRVAVPSVAAQSALLKVSVEVVRQLASVAGACGSAVSQDQQILWLRKHASLAEVVEMLLDKFAGPQGSRLAESLLHVFADALQVHVASLVCWVDPELDRIISSVNGERKCPVFRITAFVLQMRPAPVLASAGARLHQALLASIKKAVDWLENEDELTLVHDPSKYAPGANAQQQQVFLLQRAVLKRHLLAGSDVESQHTKIVEAIRLLKLTLLHAQLAAGAQSSSAPASAQANESQWKLEDRIVTVLTRSLFSFDYETVAAAMYAISAAQAAGIAVSDQTWMYCLLPLARDVASRLPVALTEIQGLGRVLQLLPVASSWSDEARTDLAERLFERSHTYLSLLRERTYAPLQPLTPHQAAVTWRAGSGADSAVSLAAVTIECFSGLSCERTSALVERLLSLATQLDAALPCTVGSGQLCTPFLAPLLPVLCRDPERTAEQLLTKVELHKVFGFLAELVSFRACLGLRKALQDKCHQMSLMDTGMLMLRSASLVSVLARHDPSYLWIQYCSIVMKASMGMPRSVSLIESLVRNWETNVAALTGGGRPPVVGLGPGGILGPSDSANAVNSYEGRIIAWSVMQFLRAPIVMTPAIVTDLDSHLNIRVRLLIRLATSLSLKHLIEISPVHDWFLTEAVTLTTPTEKRELVAKSIDAFADGAVSVGCKYVLLRFLVVPQLDAGLSLSSDILDEALIVRLVQVLMNASSHTGDVEEAVRVELLRLLVCLVKHVEAEKLRSVAPDISAFLSSSLAMDGVAVKQAAALAAAVCIEHGLVDPTQVVPSIVSELMKPNQAEHWKDSLVAAGPLLTAVLPSVIRSSSKEWLNVLVAQLSVAATDLSLHAHVWKFFLLIASGLDSVKAQLLPSLIVALQGRRQFGSTETRVMAVEVALVAVRWSSSAAELEILSNFFLRHAAAGPEPVSTAQPQSAVSPTLFSLFMDKCLAGFRECVDRTGGKLRLHDLGYVVNAVNVPSKAGTVVSVSGQPNPELARHCKQLASVGRVLCEFIEAGGLLGSDYGHIAHFFGLCLVSTDKSVSAVAAHLASLVVIGIDAPLSVEELHTAACDDKRVVGSAAVVVKQLMSGIEAGLTVASNNTGGKLRLHPLNPNSATYLVTPYMAVAVLVGVLRGFSLNNRGDEVKRWLAVFKPLLIKAVAQGSRSLVLGLLPQHLHSYALTGTKYAAPAQEPSSPTNGGFAYAGILQGAEFAVPSLLETLRLCHLACDGEERSTVMWLIECLGPFLTFAGPNHQTFSQVLNGLNFTVPQQSQKLSGAPAQVGGLANLITTVHLTALLRHAFGIVGRWCLGSSFSVVDDADNDWLLDDVVRRDATPKPATALVLSLSASLVGAAALRACCDLSPVAEILVNSTGASKKPTVDISSLEGVVRMFESADGLGILSTISDSSVKKLLGFVPRKSVTCFPGSAVADATADASCGLWSAKSTVGGLFSVAADIVLAVLGAMNGKELTKQAPTLLPAILIGSCSADRCTRDAFDSYLRQLVPVDVTPRLEWIFKAVPWQSVAGRMFLPVLVKLLLHAADDRVYTTPVSAQYAWLDSVVSLASVDGAVAYSVFVTVLPALIRQLSDEQAVSVNEGIVEFLSKPALNKQSLFSPNVAQAVLVASECSVPVPVLVHLAVHSGLWFETLEVLDAMASDDHEVSSAKETILKELGEQDAVRGAQLLRGSDRFRSSVMALLSQERFTEAREALESAAGEIPADLFIEANKSLSEWTKLLDASSDVKDPDLKLEILGKTNEWGQVADVLGQYDWSVRGRSKLFAAYLALSFSDSCHTGSDAQMKQRLFLADLEASINRSLHQAVSQWGSLPPDSEAAKDLLLLCQEFVEFSEASSLVTDIRSAIIGARPNYPTPKQLLNSWRDRLPDKCDGSQVWYELLSLRMVIFRHIQQQCAVDVVASSHIAPYLHDYPWTLVRLAQVTDSTLSQSLLHKFQQSLTRSTDAFNQELFEALKQQIRLYAQSDDATDLRTGLNVLNCCAISNSNSQQAAEICWMQGRLMMKLGMHAEAKPALQFAVNTYPMITKAWVDIGDLLYAKLDATGLLSEEEGEECLMAYMLAVTLKPSRATRLVPRMLLLASRGFSALENRCKDAQPSSVWICWVGVLVNSLFTEALRSTARALLLKICLTFPQSVFFALQPLLHSDSVETRTVATEIATAMRTEKTAPLFSDLDAFIARVKQVGEEFVDPVRAFVIAGESLEDLRYKRVAGTEIKARLGSVMKGEPSEANLLKFMKTERQKLNQSTRDLKHGSKWGMTGLVEVPGNYSRFISVPSGSTLESMSSVRIAAVVDEFELVGSGPAQIAVPRVTFVGTNGLRYSYTLLAGSTDGLGQQMASFANGLLEKHSQTKQRGLRVSCLQSVSVSRDLYLQEAPSKVRSFEQILGDADAVEQSIGQFKKLAESASVKNAEKAAFEQFDFDSSLLERFVQADTPSELYGASKRFTKSLATVSVIDHVLGASAVDRPLNRWMLARDGTLFVTNADLRPMVSPTHGVPFRLTANITGLIGDRNMVGLLPACMRAVADCLDRKRMGLIELIQLIQTDEKSAGIAGERIDRLTSTEGHIFARIMELISESVDSKNLAVVHPKQWLPWM